MIKIVVSSVELSKAEKVTRLLEKGPLQTNVLASTTTKAELFATLKEKLPDIVILHLGSSTDPDLDILRDIIFSYLGLPVLAVGIDLDDEVITESVKMGAMGYIEEQNLDTELASAVNTLVSLKDNYIPQSIVKRLKNEVENINMETQKKKLTEEEFEVMKKIAAGLDMDQIAKELSVSVRTVYTYRSRLMEKMKLDSNLEIRQYVLDTEQIESNKNKN